MIHAAFIFNSAGKPRLSKFYDDPTDSQERADVVQRLYDLIAERPESLCNFVDLPANFGIGDGRPLRAVYRLYATLYFCFVVDDNESDLGMLDLIQVFVESLDRAFENVCELDLIFHFNDVHVVLSCIIVGGLVVDTSVDSISAAYSAHISARSANAPASVLSSVSNLSNSLTSLPAFSLSSFPITLPGTGWSERLSYLPWRG